MAIKDTDEDKRSSARSACECDDSGAGIWPLKETTDDSTRSVTEYDDGGTGSLVAIGTPGHRVRDLDPSMVRY
jgi:hypothetical protein